MSNLAFSTTRQPILPSYESASRTASKLGLAVAAIWLTTTAGSNIQAHSKFVDTSKAIELPKTCEPVGSLFIKIAEQSAEPDIVQMFAKVTANIPNKEWDNIPSDFSRNFRQYMYGDRS